MSTSTQPLAIEVDQAKFDRMSLKTMKLKECHAIADCIEFHGSGEQLALKGLAMTNSNSKEKQEEGFRLLDRSSKLEEKAKKLLATHKPKMSIRDILGNYEVDRTCMSNLLIKETGKEYVASDCWMRIASTLIDTNSITTISAFNAAWQASNYFTNYSEMVRSLFPSSQNKKKNTKRPPVDTVMEEEGDVTAIAVDGNTTVNRDPFAATMVQNRSSMCTQQSAVRQTWMTNAAPAQHFVQNDYGGATINNNKIDNRTIDNSFTSDGIVNNGTKMEDKENIPCDGNNIDCGTNVANVDVHKKSNGGENHISKSNVLEPKALNIQHNVYDDALAPKKPRAKAVAQKIKESGKPHQAAPVLVGDGGNALPSTKYATSELVEPSSKDESSSPALTGKASVLSVASTKENAKVGGSTPPKKQQGSAETFTGIIKGTGGDEILVEGGIVQVTDKKKKFRPCKRCKKNKGWNKCTVHKKTFFSVMSDSNHAP